jgi:DMSO/TMAO reductase YedYZ molybdopterin-dependent catalytic subunit
VLLDLKENVHPFVEFTYTLYCLEEWVGKLRDFTLRG